MMQLSVINYKCVLIIKNYVGYVALKVMNTALAYCSSYSRTVE